MLYLRKWPTSGVLEPGPFSSLKLIAKIIENLYWGQRGLQLSEEVCNQAQDPQSVRTGGGLGLGGGKLVQFLIL